MKTIEKCGAQGDVVFLRKDEIPSAAVAQKKVAEGIVVAHSETGHHHAISPKCDVEMFAEPGNSLVCFLRVDAEYADVEHHRPYDTHETVRLPKGIWEVRRQREWTPEGWRRVED